MARRNEMGAIRQVLKNPWAQFQIRPVWAFRRVLI